MTCQDLNCIMRFFFLLEQTPQNLTYCVHARGGGNMLVLQKQYASSNRLMEDLHTV